jgi:hypothetical protein
VAIVFSYSLGYLDVTAANATMEAFNKKIDYGKCPAFEFLASGGYFRFNTETKNIPVGEYEFDLQVSNVRGSKKIQKAATVIVKEPIPYVVDRSTQLARQGMAHRQHMLTCLKPSVG